LFAQTLFPYRTRVIAPPLTRRGFVKAAVATGLLAVAADATLIEPDRPRLVRVDVTLSRLPRSFDTLTIAHLSDFHFDPYFSVTPIQAAARIVNEVKPDLVVLTGDFVTLPLLKTHAIVMEAARQVEPCADLLRQLRAPLGIWAVLGNHDVFTHAPHVETTLRQAGIQVLRNRAVPLERDGQRIWLAGVDDVLAGGDDLDRTLSGVPAAEAVVLLAHEPDFADQAANYPIDLQLSGHSHGGQVRLPFIGALYLPKLARKYPLGLRQVGRLQLYTNPGVGTLRIPVRWNCPPEVTLIRLRSLPG
jgi:predicted MPP superfamily phosphohydrolase